MQVYGQLGTAEGLDQHDGKVLEFDVEQAGKRWESPGTGRYPPDWWKMKQFGGPGQTREERKRRYGPPTNKHKTWAVPRMLGAAQLQVASEVVSIGAGVAHSLCSTTDGQLYSWGGDGGNAPVSLDSSRTP